MSARDMEREYEAVRQLCREYESELAALLEAVVQARDEILAGREAVEQARPFVELAKQELWYRSRPEDYVAADAWLAAHPAPQPHAEEQSE